MNAIEINKVSFIYPDGQQALNDLQLHLPMHKKTAILGANGSGKTTLIQHMNGIFLAQQGEVKVMGEEIRKKNLRTIRKKVGLLFDNPDSQLFSTTVFHDVAFGPSNLELTDEEIVQRVEQAMQAVEIESLRDKAPYNLSWGQKKRVAIAGILAMQPEIILFDEPFSGLDPSSLRNFVELLDLLYQQGRTLIISTHDVDVAYAWAEQVVIMENGQVLAHGDYHLLQDKQLMEQASLEVPLIAELFQDTKYDPRTRKEAAQIVKNLYHL